MLMRQIVENELVTQGDFEKLGRDLFLSGKWDILFKHRTVNEFLELQQTMDMPEDSLLMEIYKNNRQTTADEELFFRSGNDILVRGTMRYNLGCIHTHTYFEMFYLVRGSCAHLIDGAEVSMQDGDLVILAPGTSHHIQILDNSTLSMTLAIRRSTFHNAFFGLFIDMDILSDFFQKSLNSESNSTYLIFRTGSDGTVIDKLYDMYYESAHPMVYSRQSLNNQMSELFIYLLRQHRDHIIVGSDSEYETSFVLPILQYIQSHYSLVTLGELSQIFHYQPAYISKALKAETGKSFSEIRLQLRLSKAKSLLANTDLPLSEISSVLGFSDQSHFTRNFKTEYGMTPGSYREASL